ncbi:uncharacterized protein SOCEGT47_065910 [Sorangium cellulosum]|uniref:PEGA domain-containing protein n=2 Tax=Sorangium cellulosum TaxID=56 RepID=A0A4P2Q9W9_SORCE|nr:uncharacterized protein SOCEGT47_065910 [Sorangium cellulosum]
MRSTAAALCALSACALAPAAAHAQGSPPPAVADDDVPGDTARAARLYREGNRAFEQKRWADAELAYLKAWALVRSFDIAANLGEVQLRLKKPRSAAAFLAFSLRTAPPSAKPEHLARVRHFLKEARKHVGAVRVQVTNVPDAEVFVDGERVPAEEVKHEIFLEPGEHRVVIRRAGYQELVLPMSARPGGREMNTVVMKREAKAAEAPETKASEAAEAPEAKAPMAERAPVAEGAPVVGKENVTAPAVGVGVAEEPRSWVPVIALGAASAVALGVAVGFTVASNAASADADKEGNAILQAGGQCRKPSAAFVSPCDELDSTLRRIDTFGNGARLAYVASGALAITAAAYALWGQPRETHTSRIRALPELRTDGAGFALLGVW